MQILDEEIPLRENLKASIRKYRLLWVILLVTVFFDFVTTLIFMHRDGIEFEKNLVVQWLASHIGIIPGVLLGKSLQILAAVIFSALSHNLARATLLLIVLLNFIAIMVNLL
jgi:hypothetical protein